MVIHGRAHVKVQSWQESILPINTFRVYEVIHFSEYPWIIYTKVKRSMRLVKYQLGAQTVTEKTAIILKCSSVNTVLVSHFVEESLKLESFLKNLLINF